MFVLANGASGVPWSPSPTTSCAFGEALDALMRQLAFEIVADGEGAERVGRIVVRGAPELVEPVARAVANSPLVKTAAARRGPELRPHPAVGRQALAGTGAPFLVDLEIEGRTRGLGRRRSCRSIRRRRVRARSSRPSRATEVEYVLTLPGEAGETEVFFSDLSHEYVTDQRGVHDVRRPIACETSKHSSRHCPYIREFHGKTVVIKYGGAAMTDPQLKRGLRPATSCS